MNAHIFWKCQILARSISTRSYVCNTIGYDHFALLATYIRTNAGTLTSIPYSFSLHLQFIKLMATLYNMYF